ncbi:hypothetical protein HII36_07900 [Nonomuraea sp. NN258]|nr:hypothetical protein [Nonomuraea antri]
MTLPLLSVPVRAADQAGWQACFTDGERLPPIHLVLEHVRDWFLPGQVVVAALLTWLIARRPTARVHLLAGAAGLGAIVAENVLAGIASRIYFATMGPVCTRFLEGLPSHDAISIIWVYGPPVLIMTGVRAGLVASAGIPTLPIHRGRRRRIRRWLRVVRVPAIVALAALSATADAPGLPTDASGRPAVPSPGVEPTHRVADSPEADPSKVDRGGSSGDPSRCAPPPPGKAREPVVRPPAPRTVRRVEAVWRRLERWTAAHAPGTRRGLAPPARPRAIAAAEAAMGVRFPDDLKASLLRHDGQKSGRGTYLWWVYDPLSVAEIVATWQMLCEVQRRFGEGQAPGPRKGYVNPEGWWWHGSAIPFAADSGEVRLIVDGKGRVGTSYNDDVITFRGGAGWPSYVDLLEGIADAVERGRPLRGLTPSVTGDGELDWD